MPGLLILAPAATPGIAISRGPGGANLFTPDPKEVWTDSTVGSPAAFDIDFGAIRSIDTVALVALYGAAAGATWIITGGTAGLSDFTIKDWSTLRAVDSATRAAAVSHALWTGNPVNVRYLRIQVQQPAGNPALQIGRLMVGKAFKPAWGQEWGAGRPVIDTGVATGLISGGFGINEGARKSGYSWTLGDLTTAEVDELFVLLREDVGETSPVLVVEDPAATAGQVWRIHYGLMKTIRAFERRNPVQTRWELSMEEWI